MPVIFQKKQGAALPAISFGSPQASTRKATSLNVDPSYGFLPHSNLDREDL